MFQANIWLCSCQLSILLEVSQVGFTKHQMYPPFQKLSLVRACILNNGQHSQSNALQRQAYNRTGLLCQFCCTVYLVPQLCSSPPLLNWKCYARPCKKQCMFGSHRVVKINAHFLLLLYMINPQSQAKTKRNGPSSQISM